MLFYGAIMFMSAFLLFLVQPLIGKYILPWFGGTPAVWTTRMLFFQALLLGGYSYAHAVASRLRPRRQAMMHLFLLAILSYPFLIEPSLSLSRQASLWSWVYALFGLLRR